MSKQKSIFVSALLAILLAALSATLYIVARPVFVVFVGVFALIGFIDCAIVFCRWLEQPSENPADSVAPPEVVSGEDVYDLSNIMNEVKRDAKTRKK